MMWVLIPIGILVLAFLFLFFRSEKATELYPGPLSPPAAQLVKEYNLLPKDVRPVENILTIVQGLDAKNAVDMATLGNHFNDNYYDRKPDLSHGGYKFIWKKDNYGACQHHGTGRNLCLFAEYYRLHLIIEETAESVRVKQRAILESNHAGDVDLIKELEDGLRKEAGLNTEFVKQFKELA